MEKPEVSSYGDPPAYTADAEAMPASAPPQPPPVGLPPAAVPAAVPASYPSYPTVQQTGIQQVYVGNGVQLIHVPLVQSYVSHMLLACFAFWFCGCVCGAIAFFLAGTLLHQLTAFQLQLVRFVLIRYEKNWK